MADVTLAVQSTEAIPESSTSTRYSTTSAPQQTSYSAWVKAGLVFGTTTGAFLLAKSTGALSWMVGLFSTPQHEPGVTGALQPFDAGKPAALTVPDVAQDFGRHSVGAGARAYVAAVADDVGKSQGVGAVEFREVGLPEVPNKRGSQSVPTSGLVAYYPFNGDANDASGNGLHGTVTGATLTADRFGNPNSAYSFDGVNDVIVISDHPLLELTGNFSISLWMNLRAFDDTLLNKHLRDVYDGGWSVGITTGNKYSFQGSPFSSSNYINSNQVATLQAWKHMVYVYHKSATTGTMYIDGVADNTQTTSFNIFDNAQSLVIGGMTTSTVYAWPTNGLIDDIRIYNRALTASEVTQLYTEVTDPIPTACLVAYYPFNGDANDASGNGLHGTVTGATLTADRFGNPNMAYSFSGSGQYIYISSNSLLDLTNSFSLSLWVNPRDNNDELLLCKHNGYLADGGWIFEISQPSVGTRKVDFQSFPSGSYLDSTTVLPIGTWTHVVFTYSNNSQTGIIYLNGSADHTKSPMIRSIYNNSNPLILGAGYWGSGNPYQNFFNGIIDDILIYNCVLTPTQITALYDEVNPTVGSSTPTQKRSTLGESSDPIDPSASKQSPLSVGAIAGIAVGVVAGAAVCGLAGAGGLFAYKKHKEKHKEEKEKLARQKQLEEDGRHEVEMAERDRLAREAEIREAEAARQRQFYELQAAQQREEEARQKAIQLEAARQAKLERVNKATSDVIANVFIALSSGAPLASDREEMLRSLIFASLTECNIMGAVDEPMNAAHIRIRRGFADAIAKELSQLHHISDPNVLKVRIGEAILLKQADDKEMLEKAKAEEKMRQDEAARIARESEVRQSELKRMQASMDKQFAELEALKAKAASGGGRTAGQEIAIEAGKAAASTLAEEGTRAAVNAAAGACVLM